MVRAWLKQRLTLSSISQLERSIDLEIVQEETTAEATLYTLGSLG